MKLRVFFITLLFSSFTFGQTLSKRGFRVLPEEFSSYTKLSYLEKIYSGAIALENLSYTTKREWIVYSDRSINPTFDAPNSRRPFGRNLEFMQPLLVKNVQGSWLHVFIPFEMVNGRVNNEPVDAGWIKVSNIVVSGFPVLNDQGASKKAMALITFEDGILDQTSMENWSTKYEFYTTPIGSAESHKYSEKFRIYYVLKESSGMKLLSKSDNLSTNKEALQENIVDGWMSNSHLTNWDSRVCLEPASGREVSSFTHKTADVYATKDFLNAWSRSGWKNTNGRVKSFELSNSLMDPTLPRMPILSTPENNSRKTTKVATIGNVAGETMSDSDKAYWNNQFNSLIERQKNVNVVFVVDGTLSMGPYIKSITESIQRIVEQNIASGINTKIRFGAIVYRDYPDGDEAYDWFRLSSDKSDLQEWLIKIKCQSNDNDRPEAQYNGILSSIDALGLQQDQSNIMILIGDAGNHNPDPEGNTLHEVVEAMASYKFNLISFQVINDLSHDAYSYFNKDSRAYLYELALSVNKIEGVKPKLKKSKDYPNTFELEFKSEKGQDLSDLYMFGRFTYAPNNSQMDPKILEGNIRDATQGYLNQINTRIQTINRALDGGLSGGQMGEYDSDLPKVICQNLINDPENYAGCLTFVRSAGDFSYVGHTNINMYDEGEVYIPVVFLSRTEFNEMQKAFSALKGFGTNSQKTERLYQAIISQTQAITGDPAEVIAEKTLNEIWQILLNIPFDLSNTYGDLKNQKIKDLPELNRSSSFRMFLTDFSDKAENFTPDAYRSRSFNLADQTYYWVPLKHFPGNNE